MLNQLKQFRTWLVCSREADVDERDGIAQANL